MPQVSVILPTYNRLVLLKETLASVFAQNLSDFFTDFDVWVIDDCSDDGTKEFLHSLEEPRLKLLFNEKNSGVSASRNQGILASQGRWLAFIDSDDLWLPNKLARQMEYAKLNPEYPLLHSEEIWIRNGVRVNAPKKYKKIGGSIFHECFELCKISPSTAVIKRDLFEEVGLFREDFPVCEDFDLWLRVSRHYPVGFIPEALSIKNAGHPDQLSYSYHSMDFWRVLALSDYIDDSSLDPEIQRQLIQTVIKKCKILLKGFEKHKNLENVDSVSKILKDAEVQNARLYQMKNY